MSKLKIPVTAADHSQGSADAPITLVEYGDYQCPHCGRAYPIVKRVQKHFGKRLRFIFRNFPLGEMHPEAESAAESAEFASANNKFWEMHDVLFENQDELGLNLYLSLAAQLNLSGEALEQALENDEFTERVRAETLPSTTRISPPPSTKLSPPPPEPLSAATLPLGDSRTACFCFA